MTAFWFPVSAIVASLAVLIMAYLVLAKNRSSAFHRSLATLLGATALVQLGNGLGLIDVDRALFWRRVSVLAELAQPAALLYVGLALIGSSAAGLVSAARWRARAVASLAMVWALLAWSDQVYTSMHSDGTLTWIGAGSLGRVLYVFILLSLVLGLAQLEQILRATRDPLRYQLKFVLIGLGTLGGYSIYQASRLLLIPAWQNDFVVVGSLTTLISIGLLAYGLGRNRLGSVRSHVYVSPQMLYGSLTFLVVGLYLLGAGVMGELIRYTNAPGSLILSTLLVVVAAIGLAILLLSRHMRAELKRFVARHFYRSKYDYRRKWLEVTEAFRGCTTAEDILDRLIHLLSRTFGAGRITLWMKFEADGRFHQIRSVNTEPAAPPLKSDHPVVLRLVETEDIVDLEPNRTRGCRSLDESQDPFWETTWAVLCAPVRSGNELIAFLTLSRELHGDGYGTDDCDLLRAIGHHVGVMLAYARLAEAQREAAALHALHWVSAFCLHDLKNLAARLSLVTQNAQSYGQDPAFQDSAMQTVASTVQKMTALITKLSLSSTPVGVTERVDVPTVIKETLGSIGKDGSVSVQILSEPVPPVWIVREQLQQVLLNLFLNAKQAVGERGEIFIRTEPAKGSVVITVADTGHGISAARLQALFQPFQSGKAGGLGIGLYQCKQIVETHRGTIRVESVEGKGTQIRIELPICPFVASSPATESAERQILHT
jgi:putative PEP-CTERM system histidine kinase